MDLIGLELVGVPYWLTSKEHRQNQRAGTVIVAFKTEKEMPCHGCQADRQMLV
ncbi:hypothetical protein M433DRAFT_161265 [Acidomyces richmondensis BFW]|nr:hypothetical protein M433DRAFT_161265 [Acidomyces richmondensis BFW]